MNLTRERRWDWRTWNLLFQVEQATDGEDARQKSGEMTERGLCLVSDPRKRALSRRAWIECTGSAECDDEDESGNLRELPVYAITALGRAALAEARGLGITIR